jgi:hypothetical protein
MTAITENVMVDGFYGKYSLCPDHWEGGMWGKQIYEFTNHKNDPLTCKMGLILYRPDRHFYTDLGSVPKTFQKLLPRWFAKDRFAKSYIFHDSAYKHKGVWVNVNGKWEFRALTRKQADEMLYEMILLEGGSRAAARLIYAGVRMGGWRGWGKECKG